MRRRLSLPRFLRLVLTLSVSVPATGFAEATVPNVLFLIADDLRPELGCYGAAHVHSPNLDALAFRGVRFDRAYCQKAVCWPSRNSFFSGLRPRDLGKANAEATFRVSHPDLVSLPQLFQAHGYRTRGFGKVLHDGQDDPESWTEPLFTPAPKVYAAPENIDKHPVINRSSPENRVNPLFESPDVPDDAYEDGLTARAVIEAIEEATTGSSHDEPFFFMAGFHKPHTPFNAPRLYWNRYQRNLVPLAAFREAPSGAPVEHALWDWPYVRSFRDMPTDGPMPDDLAQEVRHAYFACVSYVDAQVGRILRALNRSPAAENTLVVFTSDHGYHLGDHGIWSKHTNFEIATRVPLIVSLPLDQETAPRGVSLGAPVELLDLYPTLAELAGLPLPDHVEPDSFSRWLTDPEAVPKETHAFSEFTRKGARGVSVRSPAFRYTEWRDLKTGEIVARELYDHRNDPLETRNIAQAPEHQETIEELGHHLTVHFQKD